MSVWRGCAHSTVWPDAGGVPDGVAGPGGQAPGACNRLAGYRYQVDRYLVPDLGSKRLGRLTAREVRLYLDTLRNRGLGPRDDPVRACDAAGRAGGRRPGGGAPQERREAGSGALTAEDRAGAADSR